MAIFDKTTIGYENSPAERELDRRDQEIYEARNKAAKDFERLHQEGSQAFGWNWYQANQMVASLRNLEYLPKGAYGEADKRIDALLSQVAWKIAEYMTQQQGEAVVEAATNEPKPTAPKPDIEPKVEGAVCQICKTEKVSTAWQPFGPAEHSRDGDAFSALGSHHRGFSVVKLCNDCAGEIRNGENVTFTCGKQEFVLIGELAPEPV